MQICMFLRSFVIFLWKKNGIFTFKKKILKHADLASEWRKSRFRGPPYWGAAFGGRLSLNPSPRNLDPRQIYDNQYGTISHCIEKEDL